MSLGLVGGRAPSFGGWRWLIPAAAIAFASCQEDPLPTEPAPEPTDQISMSMQAASAGSVDPDDWIVVFKKGTADPPGLARRLTAEHGGSLRFTYSYALQGFAGRYPPQSIEGIRNNPNVAFVEPDGVVYKTEVGSWGLDRIDQRDLPLNSSFLPGSGRDGSGVTAYVIDTGIDMTLGEFGGRASSGYDFIDDDADASDCDGHGTHVSGTVGSATYGVAKNVSLVAVRVLNCQGSGTYSQVIAGVDWVTDHRSGPSVANMSLGGGLSLSLNAAVNNSVAAGVVYAVASGNSSADACNYSPASAEQAITVNASTSSDARSSFSNYGPCTDIFAPGSGITSTTIGGDPAAWSGTSMASPHVAGVAALYLQDGTPAADVPAVMADRATRNKISGPGAGSPNLLLYTGTDSGDPCAHTSCPAALVESISDVTITSANGKRERGRVTVQIVVDGGGPLAGATVNGSWTVNGVSDYVTSSGTTGADGTVDLQTSWIRGASSFDFCLTSVAAFGYEDGSNGECSPYSAGGGSQPNPDPGAGAPEGLNVDTELKGRNWRANLAWTGGGATVDIRRDGAVRATVSNSGTYTDNVGKNPPTYTYQVCNTGSATVCSSEVTVF